MNHSDSEELFTMWGAFFVSLQVYAPKPTSCYRKGAGTCVYKQQDTITGALKEIVDVQS